MRGQPNDTWRPVKDDDFFPGTAEELVAKNHDFNLFISSLPDDGHENIFDGWENYEAQFRDHLKRQIIPYVDTYGKMPFLEEIIFHGFYPYSWLDVNQPGAFNWWSLSGNV